ncbi:MAG TPA: hypothetical protein VKN14_09305, partial [Flavobacteriaceae bacterium]|nr:hypothetical protein [Flavobacteriaceae bacterium]
ITYHYIDKDIDTGKIILQSSIQIEDDETQKSLYEKCMDRVFAFWPAALQLVNIGFKGAEQLGKTTTYHKRGAPYSRKIDDAWDDSKIERFIRAMHFPPLPGALYHGKEVTSINDVKRMK